MRRQKLGESDQGDQGQFHGFRFDLDLDFKDIFIFCYIFYLR